MLSRILLSAIAFATVAVAAPVPAYDPTGPSPDDPAAATWNAPAKPQLKCQRGAPALDDPSALTWTAPPHANKRGSPSPDDPSAVAKAER